MKRYDLMNIVYIPVNKKPVIRLRSRDEQRQRAVHSDSNHIPHFYVRDLNGQLEDIFGNKIREITTRMPTQVRRERDKYDEHCEADLLFAQQRYVIDKKIKCGYGVENGHIIPMPSLDIPPKRNYFDMEVETPPEVMARPINPIWPVISFQFSSNYNDEISIFMLDTDLPVTEEVRIPEYFMGCQIAHTFPITFLHREIEETIHPNFYMYDDEALMFRDVNAWFGKQDNDAAGGYNSNLFDWPMWIRRAKRLRVPTYMLSPYGRVKCEPRKAGVRPGLDRLKRISGRLQPYVKGVTLVDFYDMYKKWSGGRQGSKLVVPGKDFATSFDFHLVMERECDFHYVDLGDKVRESRTKNPLAWAEYCVGDAYALKILDKECKIFRYFDRLRRIVGLPIDWAIHNARLIDTRLLRLTDKPLPTRKYGKKHRVKGAAVLEPDIGIHENIAYIDEKTLYPMLIRVYNLSPETYVPNLKDYRFDDIVVGPMEDGKILHFRSKPEGLMPRAVRLDMEEREKYRTKLKGMLTTNPEYEFTKMLETLYKFLSCSYYGVTGYENFRFYSDPVREAICFLGRESLRECEKDCEAEGYKVRYGDTDSLFVQMQTNVPGEARIIERIVSQTLKRIAWRRGATFFIEAKCDAYCKRIIFVPKFERRRGKIIAAKKRYAYTDEKDNLYVVGMAPRRSSTPKLTRELMLKWLFKVLIHKDVSGATALIQNSWKELPNYPLNKIGLPRGLHKIEYSSRNPWLDGCNYMTQRFNKVFREDKKPLLIWMTGKRQTARKVQKLTLKKRKLDRAAYTKGQQKFGKDKPKRRRKNVERKERTRTVEQQILFLRARGCDTDVICITETDDDIPSILRSYINWKKMRQLVLKNHFEPLFKAIGISWTEVLTGKQQVKIWG